MRKLLILLILTLLLAGTAPAQAGLLDDLDHALTGAAGAIINSAKALSIPTIGSETIRCAEGATCGLSGEFWTIQMSTASNAQGIYLTLQKGVTQLISGTQSTTGGDVSIIITERPPTKAVTVSPATGFLYLVPDALYGNAYTQYEAPVFIKSAAITTITTNYDIQLRTPTYTSKLIPKSYNWQNAETTEIIDNLNNKAIITPTHMNSIGVDIETSGSVFVDDGYGNIEMYESQNFKTYMEREFADQWWRLDEWNAPKTWADYLKSMKSKGLTKYADVPALVKTGNTITVTYPAGSIGTQLTALIPKKMAQTVDALMFHGVPDILDATISPASITKGIGSGRLTITLKNWGTEDTIQVQVNTNGGATVRDITTSSQVIKANTQGTYTFELTPTVTTDTNLKIDITATSKGLQPESDYKTIYWSITVPTTTQPIKTQKIAVTPYDPSGAVLSTAPIYLNWQQVKTGYYEAEIPLGKHTISTSNESNPSLFAPTPFEFELTGGATKIIELRFSKTPQSPNTDMTWIFWGALGVVCLYIAYRQGFLEYLSKHPSAIIILILALFVFYILYQVLMIVTGIANTVQTAAANPWLPWNWKI